MDGSTSRECGLTNLICRDDMDVFTYSCVHINLYSREYK